MALIDFPPSWSKTTDNHNQIDAIKPDVISQAAKQFTDAATQAGDHSAALKSASDSLAGGVWKGPAADAFVGYVKQITTAGDKVQSHLADVGKDLDTLSGQLGDIKTKVDNAYQTAHDAIQGLINSETPKAQKAQKDMADWQANKDPKKGPAPSPTAETIISEANKTNQTTATNADTLINPLVDSANKMVQQSQELMKTQITGGYKDVPLPNSDGTVPQSHHGGGGGGGGGSHHGGGGGGGGGGLGPSGGPPSSPPPGNVQQWIDEAIKDLQAAGVNVSEADVKNIWAIIQHESGGNPNAINNWDSNAAAGHPSKGLMQCIDSTFNAHKLPGHDNIYNPVDNIIAGVRYSLDRYGSMSNVPGISAMAHGGAYRGY